MSRSSWTLAYISSLGHVGKIKSSSYIYLLSTNKTFQYLYAGVILCNVEIYIFGMGAMSRL